MNNNGLSGSETLVAFQSIDTNSDGYYDIGVSNTPKTWTTNDWDGYISSLDSFQDTVKRGGEEYCLEGRVSNSPPFLLPQGLGNMRNSIFGSSRFWGTKLFSSGFLGVLRKQYVHDFVYMRGKVECKNFNPRSN